MTTYRTKLLLFYNLLLLLPLVFSHLFVPAFTAKPIISNWLLILFIKSYLVDGFRTTKVKKGPSGS